MQIRDLVPEITWPWDRKESEGDKRGQSDDHPIAVFQREMNRAFDSFWRNADKPLAAAATGLAARADVVETEQAIEVSMELPGMEEKDIDVSLTADALTIRGEKKVERKEEKKGFYLSERSYGSVFRTIPLPTGIDTDKAEAAFKNGVLTVTLPKSAEAQAQVKKIDISAS